MRKEVLAALLPVALLAGCNNALQSVSEGPWKPVTPAQAPVAGPDGIDIRPLAAGNGAAVKVGDLVRLRYTRTVTWTDGSEHRGNAAQEAWVWTGNVPNEASGVWGDFGSPTLRLALLERRVGERFVVDMPVNYREVKAPRYGIGGPQPLRSGELDYMGLRDRAEPLVLAGGQFAWSGRSWSEVEILSACPARFSTRTGEMTQRGYLINLFGIPHDFTRRGTLRWSAIDADCPPPAGTVRFMLGPVYHTEEIAPRDRLYYWQATYESERPKWRHPAEYVYASIGGKPVP